MLMLRPLGLAFLVALGFSTAGFSTAAKAQTPEPPQASEQAPFAVTGVEVLAERDTPQACFSFNRPLEKSRLNDYAAQVEIDPPTRVSVMARNNALCLDGLSHGAKYTVTLKQGLPGAQDVVLAEPAQVRDRGAGSQAQSGVPGGRLHSAPCRGRGAAAADHQRQARPAPGSAHQRPVTGRAGLLRTNLPRPDGSGHRRHRRA